MVNFYVYSFSIAAIPLLLGVLLIWFGKKLWKKANAENAKYQQRYTGRTTLRVIGLEKHEREERDSNESGEIIYVTSYTPIYEYMVNGQRYEYHTRLGSSIDQYPVGKEYPGYYDPENPKDVTETLKDITGGGSHFLCLICFVIGGVAILLGLVRVWSVITLL